MNSNQTPKKISKMFKLKSCGHFEIKMVYLSIVLLNRDRDLACVRWAGFL